MSDISVEELAVILEKNNQWLAEHYQETIEKYPGKVVAVKEGKIVAVGNSYTEVYLPFKEQQLPVMPLVFEVPESNNEPDGYLV
jgi:uncharacterized protein YlzI (FlbEa/FlbD family)